MSDARKGEPKDRGRKKGSTRKKAAKGKPAKTRKKTPRRAAEAGSGQHEPEVTPGVYIEEISGRVPPFAKRSGPWAAPPRIEVVRIEGTSISVAVTDDPWRLAAAAVLPSAPDGLTTSPVTRSAQTIYGRTALKALGSSLRRKPIEPGEVRMEEVPSPQPEGAARHVLFATGYRPGERSLSPRLVSRSAAQAIVQASEVGVRTLAVPLEWGPNPFGPEPTVARAVLVGVKSALSRVAGRAHAPPREIILTTAFVEGFTELLRSERALPQEFKNDLAMGPDLLDIGTEVSAMAEMLSLRGLEPPVCVGILGGWGAGKSFVMSLMHRRLLELRSTGLEAAETWPDNPSVFVPVLLSPYVGHIYVIHFDAWTYAKSNLWAGLIHAVFLQLSEQLTVEKWIEKQLEAQGKPKHAGGQVWRALGARNAVERRTRLRKGFEEDGLEPPVDEDWTKDSELWKVLTNISEEEQGELKRLEGKLVENQTKLAQKLGERQKEVQQKLDEYIEDQEWAPIGEELEQQFKGALPELEKRFKAGELRRAFLLLRSETWKDLWKLVRSKWMLAGGFVLVFVVLPLALQWVDKLDFGWVVGVVSSVTVVARVFLKWAGPVVEAFQRYQTETAKARAKPHAEREAELERESPLTSEVQDLEKQVGAAEALVQQQRKKVGPTASFTSLLDFVSARLDSSSYQRELGLMHQVQQDFVHLSHCLPGSEEADGDPYFEKKKKFFPRGPARIVLFVDDLDRCPPDKVVQMLEAVQLLLKTRLFVVVMAMDVRYVTRALEKAYTDVLTRKGDPSGLDYIEKIIQVPYSVRPIEEGAVETYLREIMLVEEDFLAGAYEWGEEYDEATEEPHAAPADAPGGIGGVKSGSGLPFVVKFADHEFRWVEACCKRIELTPRSVKRLVNVFKIMRIIWHRKASKPGERVVRAVVALLALSARYPYLMRGMFEHLRSPTKKDETLMLPAFFQANEPTEMDAFMRQEWQRLLGDLKAVLPKPPAVGDLRGTLIDQVRAFSFVGEIGREPGEVPSHVAGEREPDGA